ncbi:hypothetical protein [Hugenholtzia roseola]|uniref:hypothetical protein n=1 Tax=Hugenholtzia roseola TaxID=1002 RepID=UPI00041ECF66|nr:hypothetical protein [Hugenholtzia roseola]
MKKRKQRVGFFWKQQKAESRYEKEAENYKALSDFVFKPRPKPTQKGSPACKSCTRERRGGFE